MDLLRRWRWGAALLACPLFLLSFAGAWNGAATPSAGAAVAALAWRMETVDGVSWEPVLTLDALGHPRIFYVDASGGAVKLAQRAAGAWIVRTIGTGLDTNIQLPSLALDANGDPQVAYYDRTNNVLKYARLNGSRFVAEIVDSNYGAGRATALTFDSTGTPHVSYYANPYCDPQCRNETALKYARRDGSRWVVQMLDYGPNSGEFNSIAVDRGGYPHITWGGFGIGGLAYRRWTGSAWERQAVSGTGTAEHNILLLNHSNKPHVLVNDRMAGRLWYARLADAGWVVQTIDSGMRVGIGGLALDGSGSPHIFYAHQTWEGISSLRYARWDGARWVIDLIMSSYVPIGASGNVRTLVIDGAGNPHIAYNDGGVLKYVSVDLSAPTPTSTPTSTPQAGHVTTPPAPPAAGQQRYLPLVARGAEGWEVGFQVQNIGAVDATLVVTYLGSDGQVVAQQPALVKAGSSSTFYGPTLGAPAGFAGAAVVQADQPVATVVNELWGRRGAASYTAVSAPVTRQYLPAIRRSTGGGYNTEIVVQNAGSQPATATIEYLGPSGLVFSERRAGIPPGASVRVRQAERAELGAEFAGAARVTADQPIATVVNGLGNDLLFAYSGFGSGSPRLFVPLLMTENHGWTTALTVQNVSDSPTQARVRVRGVVVAEATLAPGAAHTWSPVPGTARGSVEAAVVESDGAPLVGVVEEVFVQGGQVLETMVYRAFTGGSAEIAVPLLMTDNRGWWAGLQVQNVGAAPAPVTLLVEGQPVASASVGPGGSATWFPIPGTDRGFVGSARVVGPASAQLAAIVNQIYTPRHEGDRSMAYELGGPKP